MDNSDDELWGDVSETDLDFCVTALDNAEIEDIQKPKSLKFGRKLLTVSDLVSQTWCEQQLEYNLTVPMAKEIDPIQIAVGKSIHLTRELEIQDRVPIKITSREDAFAVKIINLLTMIYRFLNLQSKIVCEVPVFGIPFQSDIYITGIVDELRFDPDTYEITLIELKTRTTHTKPSESQAKGHKIQAMLYKYLFNSMIQNRLSKVQLARHLGLNLVKDFNEEIVNQLQLYTNAKSITIKNLNSLLEKLFISMQPLPLISNVLIEYRNQNDCSLIDHSQVVYDEIWLQDTLYHLFKFWKSERQVEGVIMDELWKCNKCPFIDNCAWRIKKNLELQKGPQIVPSQSIV